MVMYYTNSGGGEKIWCAKLSKLKSCIIKTLSFANLFNEKLVNEKCLVVTDLISSMKYQLDYLSFQQLLV